MRIVFPCLFLLAAIASVVGCGAHRSYTIQTDEEGSLRGVRTSPQEGDSEVPADVWIGIYWVAGYRPPAEFRFALRDGLDMRVYTYKHDGDRPYEWWFEPMTDLQYGTRYTIEIKVGTSKRTFHFWTAADSGDARSRVGRGESLPASPRTSKPLAEHTITIRR